MTSNAKNISGFQATIDSFDEILADEKNLNTRSGLRFAMTLIRESFSLLEGFRNEQEDHKSRLTALEAWQKGFTELRREEKEYKVAGITVTGQMRVAFISGGLVLISSLLTVLLSK